MRCVNGVGLLLQQWREARRCWQRLHTWIPRSWSELTHASACPSGGRCRWDSWAEHKPERRNQMRGSASSVGRSGRADTGWSAQTDGNPSVTTLQPRHTSNQPIHDNTTTSNQHTHTRQTNDSLDEVTVRREMVNHPWQHHNHHTCQTNDSLDEVTVRIEMVNRL